MPTVSSIFDRVLIRLALCMAQVQLSHLHQLPRDLHERIERSHRILKDHRDATAANLAHLFFGRVRECLAIEDDFAGDDLAGRTRESDE